MADAESTDGHAAPHAEDAPYLARLRHAPAHVVGRFTSASNVTLLVALEADDGTVPRLGGDVGVGDLDPHAFAVYKPALGEASLWDFPDGALWRRELAAWVLDRALGLGMVPTTVHRTDLEHGEGVLQRVVPHDPQQHYFALRDAADPAVVDQLRRMVVLDLLMDNADRKGGHVLLEQVGDQPRVRLIDHGVCFHEAPHLRTVAWDHADEPLRDDERALGARLVIMLDGADPAVAPLRALLTETELVALRSRAEHVAGLVRFPRPVHDRQVPWPLL